MARGKNLLAVIGGGALAALVAACSSAPAVPDAATSKKEIAAAYQTLFSMSDKAVGPKVAVIQDGSSLRSTIAKELSSPLAGNASGAIVHSVQILSASGCKAEILPSPCAAVDYEIILPRMSTGNLTGLKGFAVYQDGTWLVAKTTICALFTLAANNVAPPGC